MSTTDFAAWMEELKTEAQAAGIAEQEHQKQAARRAAELKEARAFGWRRVNLLRGVASAVRNAEDEDAAVAAGRTVFLREVSWNGASAPQREVADRFAPLVQAVWAATRPEPEVGAAEVQSAWTEFEDWYAEARGRPFLTLMERDIVELPLVET